MEISTRDLVQGSPEWYEARRGLPTASCFATVMAKGEGKTRRTYLYKLAGELLTGEVQESYTNQHLERGKAMEADARMIYAFTTDTDPEQVGFIRNGVAGCSPDSLIGEDGLLEIKTELPHLLIETIIADKFPAKHRAQCQGALWVTGRKWIDIAIYWPKMPIFIKRAYRDEDYIQTIRNEVHQFSAELAETLIQVRKYGGLL